MCRLYGFRASSLTRVECTLVRAQNALLAQSRLDARGTSNPDGWGIASYDDGAPRLERCDTAAFEDLRFSAAAEQIYARTVLAHVRRATVGGATSANTHPFSHGRWSFVHNGTVTAFDRVGKLLEEETDDDLLRHRHGTTDSELIFYWLLTRIARSGIGPNGGPTELDRLGGLLGEAVRFLARERERQGAAEPAKLNLMLTDGEVLIASRWGNTLHWVTRRGVHDCEVCGVPHVQEREEPDYRAAVVASERISQESWQEVPEGSVLLVDRELRADLRPI